MKRLVALLLLLPGLSPAGDAALSTSSPDGHVVFALALDADGIPRYSVRFHDQPVIAPSRLGLSFGNALDLERDFRLLERDASHVSQRWEQPWGERRYIDNNYREGRYQLASSAGGLTLRVRVYDDGLAFRYEVSELYGETAPELIAELTEFRVDEAGRAWWQTGDGAENYEHLYRETAIDDVDVAHTPITMRTESGICLSFHEAALVDYSAYRFERSGARTFRTALRPWSDGVAVYASMPLITPWRTIQLSRDATGLLNSDLIINLNEPNRLGDVSWVEPGKYAGIWWEIHRGIGTWAEGPRHAATTAAAKRKIDFAARYGFSGVLVEGWNRGWDEDWVGTPSLSFTQPAADFDLTEVAAYAKSLGVRLVGHHETGGFVSRYEQAMDEAFDLLEEHGVRQVKTGYVGKTGTLKRIDVDGKRVLEHRDGQFAVRHHLEVLAEAAERRISINTHEPVKDTGLRRTYPNWISREGGRGQEFNVWGARPNPPEHEVMLAYTRLLAGPMDYTPGVFDLDFEVNDKARRVETTLARQLALYVTIYSPIQMVPDLEQNYERYPDMFRFIIDVPTDWAESRAIAGEIGEYVVIARKERDGDDWYLGAITDEEGRKIEVPLAFLEADARFEATVYRDGDDAHWDTLPYAYSIETQNVSRKDKLELRLAPGGGAAVRFRKL